MAAPLRTTVSGSGARLPSTSSPSSLRSLANFSPAKAQVQSIANSILQDAAPVMPPPSPSRCPSASTFTSTQTSTPSSSHAPFRTQRLSSSGRLPKTYFDTSGVLWLSHGDDKNPDPNKAKLGRTLRVLQERLPTLLQSPLPQDILSPNISLHLFPSTHPHLPTVSGRVAYNAALWTSPIAWNRVPIIGNVRLEILSERMTSEPLTFLPRRTGATAEQLVVRWCEKRKGVSRGLGDRDNGGAVEKQQKKAFTGLFIFDFDQEGRILAHTIEQVQEGGDWEKGVGAKFVGLTDWLLGGMRDPGDTPIPMFERKRRDNF